jgi:TonB family protein
VAAFAAIVVTVFLVPMPQQAPPRDPARPGLIASDGSAVEAGLQKKIAAAPADIDTYLELSTLQEGRGAVDEAEATLLRARKMAPADKRAVLALGALYNRAGQFDKTVAMMELAADLEPSSPQAQQRVATFYWEKASKDRTLLPAEQFTYVTAGLAASDRALAINPDYVDALVFKGLLLRQRSMLEADPVQKQQTIAEATAVTTRAIGIRNTLAPTSADAQALASHAPRDPLRTPSGMAPVRVGGNIAIPTKIKDVRPVYPPDAKAAGISGVVIMEAVIGLDGRVFDAKILRSIPLLDQAAMDAVMQWEFTPTDLNGQPVPVIMTVTVNFTLQ